MATSFDRWEKDPFFAATEEVQESADRMESVYRRWMQERKVDDTLDADGGEVAANLRRGIVWPCGAFEGRQTSLYL